MYRFNNNSYCQCNCSTNKKCNNVIEVKCANSSCPCKNKNSSNTSSGCGFKSSTSVFPLNPMLGQSYVPIQEIDKTFTPICGLKNGTLFPELVNTYYPGQSMMDIDYLRMSTNVSTEV